MLAQRLVWGGGTITSLVMGYLAWAQVENQLARWSFSVVFGLLFVGSIIMLPWGQNEDGSPRRLANVVVRGRRNPIFVAGESSTNTGNVLSTGEGPVTVNVHGLQVTLTELRELTLDASRAVVVPEARTVARVVASEAAVQAIEERSSLLVEKVIDRFNETDPALFTRWDDPRFLAALTSAQRSFAETGDETLADLHAKLLTALASQKVRSRREIIVRQAIDVAARLTTEHINALAVKMYLTSFKLTEAYDTDQLIGALDTLLSPYYGRVPSSQLDYQYMSSTGVGYIDQLQAFGSGPYEILHSMYPNSMYPAFTLAEMRETLLSDDNENREQNQKLLGVLVGSPDDIVQTEQGTAINPDAAQFRVAPDQIATVLSNADNVVNQLTEPQKQLRAMVQQRSLSVEQFKDRVIELKPALADFLGFIQRTGALSGFQLHPVGFILAQHEVATRTPQLAALIDSAIDQG